MKQLSDFDKRMGLHPVDSTGITWVDAASPQIELTGFAWFAKERLYRRMPIAPAEPLPEAVDYLANNTSGGKLRFASNSSRIQIRVKRAPFEMIDTIPYTSQAGFDLYLGAPGKERFLQVTRTNPENEEFICRLFSGKTEAQCFTVYFPLYHAVHSVEIGMDESAELLSPPPLKYPDRFVAVYGTSITQGGCASRPGMSYTNILSRRLSRHFYNFGFSGSGKGEPVVARTLASLRPVSMFLLDYEANAGASLLDTLPEFIRILRNRHSTIPILVLSRFHYSGSKTDPEFVGKQRRIVESFNDPNLFFHDGSEILGDDFEECLVDGVHATDMAFYRMANVLESAIQNILIRQPF